MSFRNGLLSIVRAHVVDVSVDGHHALRADCSIPTHSKRTRIFNFAPNPAQNTMKSSQFALKIKPSGILALKAPQYHELSIIVVRGCQGGIERRAPARTASFPSLVASTSTSSRSKSTRIFVLDFPSLEASTVMPAMPLLPVTHATSSCWIVEPWAMVALTGVGAPSRSISSSGT